MATLIGNNLGMSREYPAKSGLSLKSNNPHLPSGYYWVQSDSMNEPLKVYVDMETGGGGWTLLVCSESNAAGQWNADNLLRRNVDNPSITSDYSILDFGDSLKTNLGGKLQYRIDAESFGRWGGIWEAPFSNTFTSYTKDQPLSTNLVQWDSWTIDTTPSSTTSLTNLMPWLYPTNNAMLSTWGQAGSWWGTLITNNTSYNPAPYISSIKPTPGIIWYWVK